jgi:REP element-mobilizing transposase RayT
MRCYLISFLLVEGDVSRESLMPTSYDARVHHRRAMRLESWDYTWPWWYYVTICAHDRRCLFGEVRGDRVVLNQLGRIVEEGWLRRARVRPGVELDAYVVMPNHLHGIMGLPYDRAVGATRPALTAAEASRVAPTRTLQVNSLGSIIGQIKSLVTKRARSAGLWCVGPLWQRGFYDHLIRNDPDLHRIRTYIRYNPLQWAFDEENPGRRCWSRANNEALIAGDTQNLESRSRQK